MKYFKTQKAKERLDKLLRQYTEYNEAVTEEEKNLIAGQMMYSDPIVWIMYKHKAYIGSGHEITTLGALREHCDEHGGICAKRFDYLSKYIKTKYKKDIRNPYDFADDMLIEDFYCSDILDMAVSDNEFLKDWQNYEFYKKDGKVAKWQNYLN